MIGYGLAVLFTQLENLACSFSRFDTHLRNPTQEKGEPTLPITSVPNGLELVVILLSMALEEVRQIEDWLLECGAFAKEERD